MTSSQSLGRAENVFFPCDCFNYGLAMVKNLSLPAPSIQSLLRLWDPNAQPSKSHLTAMFWRSVIPVPPHQSQWFCTPKWVFSTVIVCSNDTAKQRGSWRGHQAQRAGLWHVQVLTSCVASNEPFSTAMGLSHSVCMLNGIFCCHTNKNKSRKHHRNLWKYIRAAHTGFTVWFPWQPPMLNLS